MSNWMRRLHKQYEKLRAQYPEDKLLILFDIDGTILDMRCMMLYVLKAYDDEHGTEYFEQLRLADVTVHENQVETLLKSRNIPSNQRTLFCPNSRQSVSRRARPQTDGSWDRITCAEEIWRAERRVGV